MIYSRNTFKKWNKQQPFFWHSLIHPLIVSSLEWFPHQKFKLKRMQHLIVLPQIQQSAVFLVLTLPTNFLTAATKSTKSIEDPTNNYSWVPNFLSTVYSSDRKILPHQFPRLNHTWTKMSNSSVCSLPRAFRPMGLSDREKEQGKLYTMFLACILKTLCII